MCVSLRRAIKKVETKFEKKKWSPVSPVYSVREQWKLDLFTALFLKPVSKMLLILAVCTSESSHLSYRLLQFKNVYMKGKALLKMAVFE